MIEWIMFIISVIIAIMGILWGHNSSKKTNKELVQTRTELKQTREEFQEYGKKSMKAIQSMALQIPSGFTLDPHVKTEFQPESQSKPAYPDLSTGVTVEKWKVVETDPIVQDLVEYGIKEFGKKVIDDWLYSSEDDDEIEVYECPECGAEVDFADSECPECGEDLEEEE